MLKKLQHKFIFTNMLMVTIILVIVVTAVGLVNHHTSESNVRRTMEYSISSSVTTMQLGTVPTKNHEDVGSTTSDSGTPPTDGSSSNQTGQGSADGNTLDKNPSGRAEGSMYLPVIVYRLDDSGTLTLISHSSVSISDDVLSSAAGSVIAASDGFGKLDSLGLYYMKSSTPDGTKIAFADKTDLDSTSRSLVLSLSLVGALAWLAFFVISIFLSRWATGPVKKAWEQQTRFVADASHELKTPLTVILANNSILMAHTADSVSSQIQWVESTQSEAELMQTLVNDLLFLAKPESEEERRLYSEMDLSELVDRNLLQFESVAFEKHIELTSDITEGLMVKANNSRMQRLVGTLLDNACKYANKGGTVNVQLVETAHRAQLSVSNTGNTIASEDLPYIFDRFYRADKARTRDNTGYGLGLSIAKEVAEELGGTLQVSQREGYATTFTAEIPLA